MELDESVVVEDEGGVVEDWSPLDDGGSVEEEPPVFGGRGVAGCGSTGGSGGLSSSSPISMSSLELPSPSRAMVNTFAKRECPCC